jgi:hypothetical protein
LKCGEFRSIDRENEKAPVTDAAVGRGILSSLNVKRHRRLIQPTLPPSFEFHGAQAAELGLTRLDEAMPGLSEAMETCERRDV